MVVGWQFPAFPLARWAQPAAIPQGFLVDVVPWVPDVIHFLAIALV